jgi:hypothetical protein
MTCRLRTKETDNASTEPQGLGKTTIRLPLAGIASTDPGEISAPLLRPFWLLAGLILVLAGLWFLLLSQALLRIT